MTGYCVIFITVPVDKGEEIGEFIIREKLGACVNILDVENSIYWWKGNIEKDKEKLLIVKTSVKNIERLIKRVKEIHPYTVPEIIALPIIGGNEDYLKWIDESLENEKGGGKDG